MKAKVIATGEIINVNRKFDNDYKKWRYVDVITNETYCATSLDFDDVIDWEQRRYEIAKEVYPYCHYLPDGQNSSSAVRAVKFADALIEELKKK